MGSKGQIKILITGGLGNLGLWLSKHLVSSGYDVSILSKSKKELSEPFQYTFIQCDISDSSDCQKKLNGLHFDYVIHAASSNETFVPNYFNQALMVNTLGTRNLLESLQNTPLKNFIYFSTYHVYGIQSGTIDETSVTTPQNDYASTHLFAEKYIEQFHRTKKLPYTILRLTNSYGCPADIHSSKWYLVLNDLAKMAFEKQEIILKTNGNACRDFIWMGDVCNIVSSIIESETPFNQIFNVSAENTLKVIDIANYVKEAYKQQFNTELLVKVNTEDKTTYPNNLIVSSAKLKKNISFQINNKCIEEAVKVFHLLEKHSKN